MKRTTATILSTLLALCSLGQITTLPNGNVGIGIANPQLRLEVVIPVSTSDVSADPNAYGAEFTDFINTSLAIRSLGNGTMHLATDYPGRALLFGGGLFERTLSVNASYKVGIGINTSSPASLELRSNSPNASGLQLTNLTSSSPVSSGQPLGVDANGNVVTVPAISVALPSGTSGQVQFNNGSSFGATGNLYWNNTANSNNGSLSIGNVSGRSAPTSQYTLNVAGNVRADKLTVNATGADFVFRPAYKLRPLPEVEAYLKKNHRLPGIKPAATMQREGVEIGEAQTKLLQKVEEQMLYIIQQAKDNEAQSKKITELDKRIADLEARIKK